MVQQAAAKIRPRSMQFEKSPLAQIAPQERRTASRDEISRDEPVYHNSPGNRVSSLPITDGKEFAKLAFVQHRRQEAPRLPLTAPLSYVELYPDGREIELDEADYKLSMMKLFNSQPPRVPEHSISEH